MTFTIRWASMWNWSDTKTFSSLEELKAFADEQREPIIIYFDTMTIMVYDDYIE